MKDESEAADGEEYARDAELQETIDIRIEGKLEQKQDYMATN